MFPTRTQKGITLVELLVVLAIFTVLISLLLPAVQQARAAARTIACLNNARQIGLASIAFHDTHRHLPTEALLSVESPGWALDILPQIEQAPLWSQFDVSQPIDADVNAYAASAYRPPIFRCPQNHDSPQTIITGQGKSVAVLSNHYAFNSFVLGIPMARIRETDQTMLARDSGSSAHAWHSSPFVSVFNDSQSSIHAGGTVVVYVSGRAELRANDKGLILNPAR